MKRLPSLVLDSGADAAYVQLGVGNVATTLPVNPGLAHGLINLDFDEAGHLLGIEILDAGSLLTDEAIREADPPSRWLRVLIRAGNLLPGRRPG